MGSLTPLMSAKVPSYKCITHKMQIYLTSTWVPAVNPKLHKPNTVFIGEEDTMVNKIVVVDKIVHLGPLLGHCRGLLYKIVW